MAWSKKLKKKMKKRVLGTLAILTLTCTLFVSGKILTIPTLIKQTTAETTQYALANSVDITRIGNQTAVQVTGVNPDGVNSIQVLQENNQIASYNYDGSSNFEKEKVAVNIPFGESTNIKVKVNGSTVLSQDVENLRYIGTAQELKKFADLVNAGDTFEGRIVELTADIDLSTVCSEELGSWETIGKCTKEEGYSFDGVFNGNYHKIKNLYIDNNYTDNGKIRVGLFRENHGVIENVILENIFINQTGVNKDIGICVAGIAVFNYGVINNCGIESGSINVVNNATSTTQEYRAIYAGGITSYNYAYIANCYNKASISGANYRVYCVETFVGGIAGSCGSEQGGKVYNCYNTGDMHASAYTTKAGGILGRLHYAKSIVANSYNTGNVTEVHNISAFDGGIVGQNGWNMKEAVSQKGNIENSYCTTNANYSYWYVNSTQMTTSKAGRVGAETLKGYASTLGNSNWVADTYGINDGYPILKWQIPVRYELNEKQVYLKQGETLQLKIDDSSTDEALGSITWKSDNSSIAKVDSTGKVTAVGEGVTTVYSTESKYGIQVMCIINVAKSGAVAISQAYTSNPKNVSASSVILKEDGTVWCSGDNEYGQLGDGTNISSKEPVQVKINNTTYLTDVVKIATGNIHNLALTSTGEVYGWGCNDAGEIGIGSTDNQYYATRVLTPDGQGYLKNIVDISADMCSSKALSADGYVYSWGYNNMGQCRHRRCD